MNKKLVFNLIILGMLVLVQCLGFLLPPEASNIYLNFIRPFAYISIATVTIIIIGFDFGFNKLRKNTFILLLIGVVLYILLMFLSGLILGFGRNPMAPSGIVAIMSSFWQFVPFVVLSEIIRFQLVKNSEKKHRTFIMWLVVLVFSFVMLENIRGITAFSMAGQMEYLFASVLPVLVINFFLTYVCKAGSLAGNIIWRCVYSLSLVFLPYLPDITKLFLSILIYADVFVMFFIFEKMVYDKRVKEKYSQKHFGFRSYVVPALLLVICLTFGLGVFPFTPVAVASNSMQGEFVRGDMVIIKKLDTNEVVNCIKEGDIIQYASGNISIIHRVIKVDTDYKGELFYITKGDKNEKQDRWPVYPRQVVGVVQFSIPYIGFPVVLLGSAVK